MPLLNELESLRIPFGDIKESDVYLFGVVLFEVLCGRLCFINVDSEHRFLHYLAQRYYKKGKIDEIMDPALKNQIDADSLNKVSKIAYQCLRNNRERRPSMCTVVKKLEELEKALKLQQQEDTDQLLDKTQARMDGAVPTGGEPTKGTTQLKRSFDDMQNNLFISSMVKTKKRVHDIHTSDSTQRSLFKAEKVEPDLHNSEHVLKSEIAKFTYNGGLVDFEGVEKLIQLMQLESCKKNMDIACRVMLLPPTKKMSFLEELESLRIPFPDIQKATENFTIVIGKGGYGLVYKGELLLSGKLTTVAVKRLDGNVSGQGFKEFLTEIQLLTRYKHQNLISLIGFCDEDNEKILIYEHTEHGSLDKYLSTAENRSKLTWKRRINICVNAARGLKYLHNEAATNERVIHRDIKSANVLLDRNWKAMISDLGLSKLGRPNEKDTFLITNASGTYGYCDPVYISSGILTKESDVYSFGVVLFEVLCGRLCFINVNNEYRFLPPLAQRHYKLGNINEIMDPALKKQIDSDYLKKFSKIAYQCLRNNRKRQPSMHSVVQKLEIALNLLNM